MSRSYTEQLIGMVDDGIIDQRTVMISCLKWMSDRDVGEMMRANNFVSGDPDYYMGEEYENLPFFLKKQAE